jgi:Zn-dependent peptidase ImmA (M78 family)
VSTGRILAHELGHAVMGTCDCGPGRMRNIILNENPIAGEFEKGLRRTAY